MGWIDNLLSSASETRDDTRSDLASLANDVGQTSIASGDVSTALSAADLSHSLSDNK